MSSRPAFTGTAQTATTPRPTVTVSLALRALTATGHYDETAHASESPLHEATDAVTEIAGRAGQVAGPIALLADTDLYDPTQPDEAACLDRDAERIVTAVTTPAQNGNDRGGARVSQSKPANRLLAAPAQPPQPVGCGRAGGIAIDPKGDRLMLDTQRPQTMTVEDAEAVKAESCGQRRRYSRTAAHVIAVRRNARRAPGERPWSAYRCSFATDGHFHVGRVITVKGMVRVALAIRTLRQAS